jgi:hypothetical protein
MTTRAELDLLTSTTGGNFVCLFLASGVVPFSPSRTNINPLHPFTSLPRVQDTGGENPYYIDSKDVRSF